MIDTALPLFYKTKIKEHEIFKEIFLEEYQEYVDSLSDSEYKTDYFKIKDSNFTPPYSKVWRKIVDPYLKEFANKWGCEDYKYKPWIAQYYLDATHEWHTHPGHQFAVVYFMELPFGENSTDLYKIEYPAQEGELLFFPACWIHRSAPNMYNERKTVIAGNLDLKDHVFLP